MTRASTYLPGVPLPYPDELLYSVLARTSRCMGLSSPKLAAEVLLGSRNALAVPDLPTRLRVVESWASEQWRMRLDDLVFRHTAAPYYAAYREEGAYRGLIRAMRGSNPGLHLRLGICTSVVADTAWFRICDLCVKDDVARRGETYWRRTHQLPGVLVCPTHHLPLRVTSVPYRSPRRNPFVAPWPGLLQERPSFALDPDKFPELALPLADRLARLCCVSTTDPMQAHDYRHRLRAAGYVGVGAIDRFTDDMTSYVGPVMRQVLFRRDADTFAWMRAAARTPRRPLHPVIHTLMQLFLESRADAGIGQCAAQCCGRKRPQSSQSPELRRQAAQLAAIGYRPAAIARTLEVDRQTANRLLQPLMPVKPRPRCDTTPIRRRWLELVRTNPSLSRAQLRAHERALYARFYRFDRAWLMQNGPCRRHPRRAKPRIDWNSRDERLSERIRSCADRLRREEPRLRASANRILGEVRARAQLSRYGHHLPRAKAALRQCCETVEAHQLKRVVAVLDQVGAGISDGQVLRYAGVNPDRFADGARRLIESARLLAIP